MAKKRQKKEVNINSNSNAGSFNPPMQGEYANWAAILNSEMQTIIDFGFVQPTPKGQAKTGVIIQRIILPIKVAKELGNILTKSFKDDSKK